MTFTRKIMLLAAVAVVLAGCGLKGPLYLPKKPVVPVAEQADQPAPASEQATPESK